MRLSLADAGDGVENANFVEKIAEAGMLRLHSFLEWVRQLLSRKASLRQGEYTFNDMMFARYEIKNISTTITTTITNAATAAVAATTTITITIMMTATNVTATTTTNTTITTTTITTMTTKLTSTKLTQEDLSLLGLPSGQDADGELEPATDGSLQISGRIHYPLCHHRPSLSDEMI
ncbi:leucine--tRNA ligase, cytoplasmic [Plakobranchus ocellatus]|uniref:Leucine--tRNA ligase, cytoplasmic n=1 Tax=Plakobranchus ocellatus TaxID=259542 RepID=A0AAV3YD27_9GAST|nr:leucine--tRNA ligase, cytoplasmic [Plakobranchus ocellatus]